MGSKIHDVAELKEVLEGKIDNKNFINDYLKWNLEKNEEMDKRMRMALFAYAKENPQYLDNLGLEKATDAVRYALFDPENLTTFEKDYLKRIIPFYTFTKQNLYFQVTNLMKNTPKYNRLVKGFNSMYNSLDEDEFYQYQKDTMQLPFPFTDGKGNRLYMKLNLPITDLFEYAENPLQRVVSATAPWIKAPIEAATGINTFTGEPLRNDTIDKLYKSISGKELPSSAKTITQKAEFLLNSMGLSNVSTNILKKFTKAVETYKGDADVFELIAELVRSILQNTNEENVKNSKLYEELDAYSNYISQLKASGTEVPTINDMKLNKLKNKRALLK